MTSINRDRALWSQILLVNACQNFLFQLWQSVFRHARNSQCREILPVLVLGQITLIQDNNFVRIACRSVEMRRLRRIAVGNVKPQISQLQRFLCALDSRTLQFVFRSAQAGGVEQPDRHTLQIDRFLDRITRRAVRVADNHAIVAKQAIEQTRFAGVCRTVNHDAHAFAQHTTLIGSREQHRDLISNRIKPGAERFVFVGLNAFLGKINRRVDVRQQRDQVIANFPDLIAESSFELFRGRTQRQISSGTDQIDHRLGLGEIHFAVEKCALGEFAWPRCCRACTQTCFENFCGNEGAAVTTDLDEIFAGVTSRCTVD